MKYKYQSAVFGQEKIKVSIVYNFYGYINKCYFLIFYFC